MPRFHETVLGEIDVEHMCLKKLKYSQILIVPNMFSEKKNLFNTKNWLKF